MSGLLQPRPMSTLINSPNWRGLTKTNSKIKLLLKDVYANWNQVTLVTKILRYECTASLGSYTRTLSPWRLHHCPVPVSVSSILFSVKKILKIRFKILFSLVSNKFGPIWYLFLWSICFYLQLLSKKEKHYVRMCSDSATRNIISHQRTMMPQSKQNDWPMWKHYLPLY